MAGKVLIAEKEVPLEMEGIQIGKVQVKIFEGPPVHVQTEGVNRNFLIAKGVFHDKEYEAMSSRGGIEGVVEELKKVILKDLSK